MEFTGYIKKIIQKEGSSRITIITDNNENIILAVSSSLITTDIKVGQKITTIGRPKDVTVTSITLE